MIGSPDNTLIRGTLASIHKHELEHQILSSDEIRERFQVFQTSPEEIGIFEKEAGFLIPEACIEAHLLLASSHGAHLHHEETFLHWSPVDANQIAVTTSKAIYFTRKLVLSVGPWAPQVYGKDIPMELRVERRVLFWVQPEDYEPFKASFPICI